MGGVEEGAASRETDIHWVRNRVLLKLTVWKESEVAVAGLW